MQRRTIKRVARRVVAAVLVLLFGAAAVSIYLITRQNKEGSSLLEQWIGRQFESICDDYLNPKLTFDSLNYQFPGTVHLKNLRLASADPAHPGQDIVILSVARATVQLAAIPRIGQPIRIGKISLDHPVVRLIAAPGRSDQFVGFSNLLKNSSSATAPSSNTHLSEYFQMRLVEVIDGRILYDPRQVNAPPMDLDQIQTRLNISPARDGSYAMRVALDRAPEMKLSVGGRLNLDTLAVTDLDLRLDARLSPQTEHYLPPQIQHLLNEHAVRGQLSLSVTGNLPLLNYQRGDLQLAMKLDDSRARLGNYNLALNQMNLDARLADGALEVRSLKMAALDGQADLHGTMKINPTLDTRIHLTAERMKLDDLFTPPPGQSPPVGGRINLQLDAAAPLAIVLAHLAAAPPASGMKPPPLAPLPDQWGLGYIQLEHGKLMNLPVIKDLDRLIGKPGTIDDNDSGEVNFFLSGDKVRCTRVKIIGSWFAVRGFGLLGLNQTLDFTLNGGPLEKMESMIGGEIGQTIGDVTDALASYNVVGTIQDPKIVVNAGSRTLGNTARQAGGDIKKGVSQGIDAAGRALQGLFGK